MAGSSRVGGIDLTPPFHPTHTFVDGAAPPKALHVAFAVDLWRERAAGYSGALVDVLVLLGCIATSLLLAGFPGTGLYALTGGAVFGLVAKLTCVCVDELQSKCTHPARIYAALVALLLVCGGLIAGIVMLLAAAEEGQLCKGCMELCYDVGCMCDPRKRLDVPSWAFSQSQLDALSA